MVNMALGKKLGKATTNTRSTSEVGERRVHDEGTLDPPREKKSIIIIDDKDTL